MIKVNCDYCGKEFETYPAWAKRRKRQFCPGGDCYNKWKSEEFSGRGNPNYKDGSSLIEQDPEFFGYPIEDDRLILSWISGLIDGEGSFVLGLQKQKNKNKGFYTFSFFPTIAIRMHEREAEHLDSLASVFGYGGRYRNEKSSGSIAESWQTTSLWQTFKTCCLLWPYLKIKRRQSELLAKAAYLIDQYSSNGGYNGNVERLWTLLEIRDSINPGTYRNRNRVEYTYPEVVGIVAAQEAGGLETRNKPYSITDEIWDLCPEPLKKKILSSPT